MCHPHDMVAKGFHSVLLFFMLLCLVQCSSQNSIGWAPDGNIQLSEVADSKYRVGDVWQYESRHGEEASRFIVVKTESASNVGVIIHISVDNLNWTNCSGAAFSQQIPHLPFAQNAIERSSIRKIASGHELPNYKEGYTLWRRAFFEKHAGVYTIPIKEAVTIGEQTWRDGMGCGKAAN